LSALGPFGESVLQVRLPVGFGKPLNSIAQHGPWHDRPMLLQKGVERAVISFPDFAMSGDARHRTPSSQKSKAALQRPTCLVLGENTTNAGEAVMTPAAICFPETDAPPPAQSNMANWPTFCTEHAAFPRPFLLRPGIVAKLSRRRTTPPTILPLSCPGGRMLSPYLETTYGKKLSILPFCHVVRGSEYRGQVAMLLYAD